MGRPVKPSGGRTFSRTCSVRGLEDKGRVAILKEGRDNVRVAGIGPDGLTTDWNQKVPASDVLDIRPVTPTTAPSLRSFAGVVGDRGAVTIPAAVRRRYQLQAGSPVRIEQRDDGILIQPAEIVPRKVGQEVTLAALLEGITPETVHPEVDTGPPVGREDW
jgi:antitoxin MazE